jgi:excisionase family DNA binding protein
MMETFLTPADAARVLGLTAASVRRMAREGQLKAAATTESGIRLFRRRDVISLVRRRARAQGVRRHG